MGLEKFILSLELRTPISRASRVDENISYIVLAIKHSKKHVIPSTCLDGFSLTPTSIHAPLLSIVNTFPRNERTQNRASGQQKEQFSDISPCHQKDFASIHETVVLVNRWPYPSFSSIKPVLLLHISEIPKPTILWLLLNLTSLEFPPILSPHTILIALIPKSPTPSRSFFPTHAVATALDTYLLVPTAVV